MIESFLSHPFLPLALFAGIAASIASGIIGSYVVAKRIVFISGSIAHSVLGGVGLFLWIKKTYHVLWISPLQGALFAALISALLIGFIHLKYKQREDTVIGVMWSTGMAIGVIFISLTPGYSAELMNFLFGNILWISTDDLKGLLFLDAVIVIAALALHKKFLAICFDEEQSSLQGINVPAIYLLLLALVAITVVILIQVVGAILVITMLAIPAAIAGRFTNRLSKAMVISTILGAFFTLLGLVASLEFNWPPGASIALTAAFAYLIALFK